MGNRPYNTKWNTKYRGKGMTTDEFVYIYEEFVDSVERLDSGDDSAAIAFLEKHKPDSRKNK